MSKDASGKTAQNAPSTGAAPEPPAPQPGDEPKYIQEARRLYEEEGTFVRGLKYKFANGKVIIWKPKRTA